MAAEIKKCLILGSAPVEDPGYINGLLQDDPFIICADGGLDLALRCGVKPDLIIGDFDSFSGDLPEEIHTIRLPVMKDDTDSMAAVKMAVERGYNDIVLAGVLGGRFDHSFANLCVLQYMQKQGVKGQLVDENTRIYYLSCSEISFSGMRGKTISIFPFACHRCNVSYKGLLYPLDHYDLYTDVSPMGVSNEIADDDASVTVHEGNAVVMVLTSK